MSDSAPDKSAEKPASAAGKSAGGMLPTIIAVVLAPVLSWVVVNFVLIPKLTQDIKSELTTIMAQASKRDGTEVGAGYEADAGAGARAAPKGEAGGKEKPEVRPKFENLTVNIAGTQGTRYLKVTFNVVGKNDAANKKIDAKHAELVDATLTILSSLSMPELNEPSGKAVVRGRLVAAFNDLLKAPLVEQVFFSDFVVQ
jgi:flagellar FliL protein